MSNSQSNNHVEQKPAPKKPNETGAISVQAYMRIFEPATNKTIVEGRA